MQSFGECKLANAAMSGAAPTREGTIHGRNTINFVVVHARAEAGVEGAVLVVVAGLEVVGDGDQRLRPLGKDQADR